MKSGVIIVNKENGISSQKCVSLIKKKLNVKSGHTGTLDLEASGVLPIVIGKATRISDYVMCQGKTYIANLEFGKRTDTLDYSGKITQTSDKKINKDEFSKIICNFKGEISQIPPMYSALKQNGKKLYELAREGINVERKKRVVKIYDIKILDFDFPFAKIEVDCSKGTYIRTLVDDIGEKLGTYAYLTSLVRTRVGNFRIEDSIKSEKINCTDIDILVSKIISIDESIIGFENYNLDEKYFQNIINGMKIDVNSKDGEYKVYCNNIFIGIGNVKDGILKMKKVFYESEN